MNTTAPKAQVLTVTSARGGVGKTTTALALATTLAHASNRAAEEGHRDKPLRVALLDLDFRDGQLGFILDINQGAVLQLFVNAIRNPEDGITENLVNEHLTHIPALNIHALAAPLRARTADTLTPQFYQELISTLRGMFDVIILDTSVNYLDEMATQTAFPQADQILFLTTLTAGNVYSTLRWIEEQKESDRLNGTSTVEHTRLYFTNTIAGTELQPDIATVTHNIPILGLHPVDSAAFNKAHTVEGVAELALTHPQLADSYFELAQKLFPEEALLNPALTPA